jgi:hypothetical protein
LIVLADKRLHRDAGTSLEAYGEVCYLKSEGITYPAISGHPDVFFCQTGEVLIHAPNAPAEAIQKLKKAGVVLCEGQSCTGSNYPETAVYNAVVTDHYLIHNLKYTDPVLKETSAHLIQIHVNQAYSRCNLMPLPDGRFFTSDRGIENVLKRHGLEAFFIDPEGILLPGQKHGFIGGTCGIAGKRIFFTGNLDYFRHGKRIREYLSGYEIVELYNGPLFDGGSLMFVAPPSSSGF